MFGTKNGEVPTGPALLLRSLGFDPEAIAANVESARKTALEVMQHFDKRIAQLEGQNELLLEGMRTLIRRFEVQSRVNDPEPAGGNKDQ